jgi:hypothetical protein
MLVWLIQKGIAVPEPGDVPLVRVRRPSGNWPALVRSDRSS